MSGSSVVTRSEAAGPPAGPCEAAIPADALIRRLRGVAAALCVGDPPPQVESLLRETFARRCGDVDYRRNRLLPGRLPLELSFMESEPDALRLDLEPFGPMVGPLDRRARALGWLLDLIACVHGAARAREVEDRAARWSVPDQSWRPAFGAFLGLTFDAGGLAEGKIYFEIDPGRAAEYPGWDADLAALSGKIEGAEPYFVSLAAGRRPAIERLYLACRRDVSVLALNGMLQAAALGAAAPAFAVAALAVTGGSFVIPAHCAIVGLRRVAGGIEIKLDVMAPPSAPGSEAAIGRLRRALAVRPDRLAALDRWLAAVALGNGAPSAAVTLLSVRVGPDGVPRYGLYAAPDWLGGPAAARVQA
jgi:hypothetical protein